MQWSGWTEEIDWKLGFEEAGICEQGAGEEKSWAATSRSLEATLEVARGVPFCSSPNRMLCVQRASLPEAWL